MPSDIAREIVVGRRNYFIHMVKAPLIKSIVSVSKLKGKKDILSEVAELIKLCNMYPEPTRENCNQPITLVLMDIWDMFFEYEDNPGRDPLFRTLRKLILCTVEHDPYYRDRVEWFIEKLVEKYLSGELKPRTPTRPNRDICWNEPLTQEAMLKWLQAQRTSGEKVGVV